MKRRLFVQSASLFALSLSGAKLLSSCGGNPSENQGAGNQSGTTNTTASEAAVGDDTLDVDTINFGIISTESQANQKPIWEPFVQAMSEEIGMPVKAFYATQYAGVIEAMRFKKVQVAWYGGKSYIEAAKRANAEAFALTVGTEGEKGYYSHLIANRNQPFISQAKDMGGDKYVLENASDLTFAFNDPNSTSGFLVPSYYIFAKNNVDPKEAFEKVVFAGSHEATALAVANNQVDVATNNNESLSRLEETNPQARDKIETIWTSPIIPSDPIAYRQDLPDSLKEKIRNFFYNYSEESVLEPLGWSGFEEADDSRWDTVRELDIGRQIMEIKSNPDLQPSEKESRLEELNKQLESLSTT
ncbi:phosphonate ABC transporter substrate-binding protein [Geitlerinema sp. PCC 9228]|jgi:phosphonate transport system substrate-binding protein|uniref:phosphonate ABC transporter substrate-binding protein n=1 Tax=Geitlerinema sp. PCC 9228 TaxID=111611 RepID=UPI0008F9C3F5|nr:phosphonate ABC transporter substrate-binding protein [Geitlerinema sp. PCC 9228]